MRSAPEWYDNPVLEVMLLDHDEPTNYDEAMMSPDAAKWLKAMKSEMGSMYREQNMQAPAIHLWTSASILELEYTL